MFKAVEFQDNPGNGGLSPMLKPGQHFVRLRKIELTTPPYADGELRQLEFVFETKDLGNDFEGLLIDRNEPDYGRYGGQIAYAKAGKYAFKTYVTKKGTEYERDTQIYNFINKLAKDIGMLEVLKEAKVEGSDIEEYVANAAKHLVNLENYFWITLNGKEYMNKGYVNYNLFLAPSVSGSSSVTLNKENLTHFDPAYNIERLAPVTSDNASGEVEDDSPF